MLELVEEGEVSDFQPELGHHCLKPRLTWDEVLVKHEMRGNVGKLGESIRRFYRSI